MPTLKTFNLEASPSIDVADIRSTNFSKPKILLNINTSKDITDKTIKIFKFIFLFRKYSIDIINNKIIIKLKFPALDFVKIIAILIKANVVLYIIKLLVIN